MSDSLTWSVEIFFCVRYALILEHKSGDGPPNNEERGTIREKPNMIWWFAEHTIFYICRL